MWGKGATEWFLPVPVGCATLCSDDKRMNKDAEFRHNSYECRRRSASGAFCISEVFRRRKSASEDMTISKLRCLDCQDVVCRLKLPAMS